VSDDEGGGEFILTPQAAREFAKLAHHDMGEEFDDERRSYLEGIIDTILFLVGDKSRPVLPSEDDDGFDDFDDEL